MTQHVVRNAAIAVALGGGVVLGTLSWLTVSVIGAVGVGGWFLTRCRHPRPLGLQPPVTSAFGEAQPAQWYCAACGRTWPVMIDRAPAPVQRFHGHDESKAKQAAKRAAVFDERRRDLAVERAGLRKPASGRRSAVTPPVSIHRSRAAS